MLGVERSFDRTQDARAAYGRALELVHAEAERSHLQKRLAELESPRGEQLHGGDLQD